MDLDHFRARLLDERHRLRRQLGLLRDELGASSPDETLPAYESFGQHGSDQASDLLEREFDRAVELDLQSQLAEIDDALDRTRSGDYGVCATCSVPIPSERLDALPWTRWCLAHQAAAERADGRVLDPPVPAVLLEQATESDAEDDAPEQPEAAEEAALHIEHER